MSRYGSTQSPDEHLVEFEKASEAEQIAPIMNPGHVDESKWEAAKKAVHKTYGEYRWPAVMYVYKKMHGKTSREK